MEPRHWECRDGGHLLPPASRLRLELPPMCKVLPYEDLAKQRIGRKARQPQFQRKITL